ncbi:c-type cytochrome [Tuwongella immobilis]|uniref:Protein containing planctomycete cytochrome c domain protein: Planctomycete cytochrome C domain protein n=1 Tax=Tuwongella immobilis TaxID=692036 RepID=A0A6C2YXY2_9BACT|nr:hypothetical protein [Tuwongella immobilis]VIP05652.1 protein containing planctomycete cytochrome c domain protein : Planctomycete cytochrome C domain protein OS=Rhodopirellula sp. SWK7 GN=RRSWK_00334 PE=4 SV=1 [Tuwongella immobilis]VTS08660.1 protein containing planctomycete cytochrome c domain protein : Planctomycete cytochrome C domain protein OS=Rhodopirellula sp. SWK7 GN=RRSWK_00334 PE=4 SV=1 [Tuwongella immobilis]
MGGMPILCEFRLMKVPRYGLIGCVLAIVWGWLLAGSPAAAPTGTPVGTPAVVSQADRTLQVRAIFQRYCNACHNGQGQSTLNVMDYAQLTGSDFPRALVTPKRPEQSQLLDLLEDGSMPPAGRPRPTAAEIALVRDWIRDGAGAYPARYDEAYRLTAILRDLRQQPDPKAVRYLSLADRVELADRDRAAGGTLPNLAALRAALQRELRPFSADAEIEFVAIDASQTIFRLPAAAMGWLTPRLFPRDADGKPLANLPADSPKALAAFDLLLLEYPHTELDFDLPVTSELVDTWLRPLAQVRPVPYLRGDWVLNHLQQPSFREELRQAIGLAPPTLRPVPSVDVAMAEAPPDFAMQPTSKRLYLPPIDALSQPRWQSPRARFQLVWSLKDALTNRVMDRWKSGEKRLGFWIETTRTVHVTVARHLADGRIRTVDFSTTDSRVVKGQSRQVPAPGGMAHEAGDTPGRERAMVWASESPLPTGIIYSNGAARFPIERLVHSFPSDRLRPQGTLGTMFDPHGIVKHALEFWVDAAQPPPAKTP